MEERKEQEIEFHNFLRDLKGESPEYKFYTSNTMY